MTVNGPLLCADRFGRINKAYQFDGVNDYSHYSNVLPQGSNFTLSFWYKSDKLSQRGDIVSNGNGATSGVGLMQNGGTNPGYSSGNKITFWAGGVSYYYSAQTDTISWHHITLRLSGNNYDYFFDNVLLQSGIFNMNPPNGTFYLGYNYFVSDGPFKGKIDDIAVYNRAITNAEVDTLFHGCNSQIITHPNNVLVLENTSSSFTVSSPSAIGYQRYWVC
jgi:hypothetical protein